MSEQKILATIDGINITEADIDAYIAKLPQEQQGYAAYPQFREHCLKQLLAFHLYAKMAVEEKMDETEEFKAMLEKARKEILAQTAINSILKDVTVTEEEMQTALLEITDEMSETIQKNRTGAILIVSQSLASFVLSVFVGLNANKWYYKYTKSQIKAIKAESTTENYKNNLFIKGGVSYGAAFLVVITEKAIFMALEMLLSTFIK
jgi:hypothetical protein